MERERTSRRDGKKLYGGVRLARRGFFLLAGDKAPGRADSDGAPGLSSVLELRRKKGYSGTAVFTKHEPISASYGIGIAEHDTEGRVITLEYEKFFLVTVYTPNSQDELRRLEYRMKWEDDFRAYLKTLARKKA